MGNYLHTNFSTNVSILPTAEDVVVHDTFLAPHEQGQILEFLDEPGWTFGAYSDPLCKTSRYWCKHFAGYVKAGSEALTPIAIEAQLFQTAPLLHGMWTKLKSTVLRQQKLARCYANRYPYGSEGALHTDSNVASHLTAIYYPHLDWSPNYAGETVFFDTLTGDILTSIYPRPNRLVIFPGTIPHVARGASRACPTVRTTLMFKTLGV